MAIFDQIAREVHERMANLAPQGQPAGASSGQFDPRDTNHDGVVSEAEAAAYIRDYLSSASPEERDALLHDYVGNLSEEQRREMGDAIVRSPENPIKQVDTSDQRSLADALGRTAQAQPKDPNAKSPLEAAFSDGGALSSPLVQAGLVGLAAAIGSKVLRGPGNTAKDHR